MLLISFALFGVIGAAMWAMQMIWIPFWAAGFVNGIGHWAGYRNFESADTARNLIPWGFWIGGEELHNNHHAFPSSAKFALRKWEFDIGWAAICALARGGPGQGAARGADAGRASERAPARCRDAEGRADPSFPGHDRLLPRRDRADPARRGAARRREHQVDAAPHASRAWPMAAAGWTARATTACRPCWPSVRPCATVCRLPQPPGRADGAARCRAGAEGSAAVDRTRPSRAASVRCRTSPSASRATRSPRRPDRRHASAPDTSPPMAGFVLCRRQGSGQAAMTIVGLLLIGATRRVRHADRAAAGRRSALRADAGRSAAAGAGSACAHRSGMRRCRWPTLDVRRGRLGHAALARAAAATGDPRGRSVPEPGLPRGRSLPGLRQRLRRSGRWA